MPRVGRVWGFPVLGCLFTRKANGRLLEVPPGTRRVLRRHKGEAGVVVYARYNRLRGHSSASGWDVILVFVDREKKAREIVHQMRRGPIWVGLEPGPHRITFRGGFRRPIRSYDIVLAAEEVVLIDFEPVGIWPFYRPEQPVWNIQQVRPRPTQ